MFIPNLIKVLIVIVSWAVQRCFTACVTALPQIACYGLVSSYLGGFEMRLVMSYLADGGREAYIY